MFYPFALNRRFGISPNISNETLKYQKYVYDQSFRGYNAFQKSVRLQSVQERK